MNGRSKNLDVETSPYQWQTPFRPRREPPTIRRRPIFTAISTIVAIVFAVGSHPLLMYYAERQMADDFLNSADAIEDTGRFAALGVVLGQVACGGIGAAIGVVLASIGFWHKERWKALRWCSLILNLAAAGIVGTALFDLWSIQNRHTWNGSVAPEVESVKGMSG